MTALELSSQESMDLEAARMIWERSILKRKLCYTTFIGEGDSKSYNQVSAMKPYEPVTINKESA